MLLAERSLHMGYQLWGSFHEAHCTAQGPLLQPSSLHSQLQAS